MNFEELIEHLNNNPSIGTSFKELKKCLADNNVKLSSSEWDNLEGWIKSRGNLLHTISTMVKEHCRIYRRLEIHQHYTTTNDLFNLYIAWCKKRNFWSVNKNSFGIRLFRKYPFLIKKQIMEGGKRKQTYFGIEILPESRREFLGGLKK